MKKVLLATTALVMTTGYAAAEVSFSGKASAGISSSSTAAVAAVTGIQPTTLQSTAGATASAAGVITAGAATAMVVGTTASTDAEKLAARNAVAAAEAALGNATTALARHDAAADLADAQANLAVILGSDAVAATDTSEVFSGIDLNVSASVTTDNGLTITVADDFGGGMIADYDDDYAVEAQTSDLDTPGITISGGGLSLTVDNQAIDDRYDDSQNGALIKIALISLKLRINKPKRHLKLFLNG
jgi:outer membrane protein OmpU